MKWKFIGMREGSSSGLPFVKETRIGVAAVWAAVLDCNLDFQFVADDFGLPVEAVKEAHVFCERNKKKLEADFEEFGRELAAS